MKKIFRHLSFSFSIYIWGQEKLGCQAGKCCTIFLGPKIQDGCQAPDMVTLTFFLWEITSKLFFSSMGFMATGNAIKLF